MRQERGIRGSGEHRSKIMLNSMGQCRVKAGKRRSDIVTQITEHRKRRHGETRHVSVRVDRHGVNLCRQRIDDPFDKGSPMHERQRLLTAHARRVPAGDDDSADPHAWEYSRCGGIQMVIASPLQTTPSASTQPTTPRLCMAAETKPFRASG